MTNFVNLMADGTVVEESKTFLEKANEWMTANPFWGGVIIVGVAALIVGVLFAHGFYKRKRR